jgi:hypothetical protein
VSTEDRDVYPAVVLNPEAIGEPNQTPEVQLSPALVALARGESAESGPCRKCKRDAPPSADALAAKLAREDTGGPIEWLSYEEQERWRRIARHALEVIG